MFKYRRSNPSNGFTLEVENFATKMFGTSTEIWESIIRARVDYVRQTITFDVFDLEGGLTVTFFDQLRQHDSIQARLKVNRYAGQLDHIKRFHGVRIAGHEVGYDYALQDAVLHNVVLSYDSVETEMVVGEEDPEV